MILMSLLAYGVIGFVTRMLHAGGARPAGNMVRMATGPVWTLLVCCGLLGAMAAPRFACAADDSLWQIELKTQFMFRSYTSYEFGNPWPPNQSPLSRLEFPMDAVWTGFEARRRLGRFSLGLGYLTTVANQESGQMRDSDWDNDEAPDRKSIYSESRCRMRPSFQLKADIDAQVADLLRLPEAFDVRPVAGFRWQRLEFTSHDGTQYEYDTAGEVVSSQDLPGDGIDFRQDWYHVFVGLRLGYTWTHPPLLHRLRVTTQGDWSYVQGRNEDLHLFRAGQRITRDITSGHAWHAMVGLTAGLTERLEVGVEADYTRIETTGRHYLINKTFDQYYDFSHGVRAWSEQCSLMLKLDYHF